MPNGSQPEPPAGTPARPGDLGAPSGGAPAPQPPPLLEAERIPPPAGPGRHPASAVRVAWLVAIVVDVVQWILWPLVAEGAASPVADILDVAVAAVMIRLLGWHWAFLPTFIAEILPGVDLVPTWTAAVFFATRGAAHRTPLPGSRPGDGRGA